MDEKLYQDIVEMAREYRNISSIPTMREIVPEAVFVDYSIEDEIVFLECHSQMNYYRKLDSKFKLIGFVKKAIRKCIKFYVEPIVKEQNVYNAHIANTLHKLETQRAEQQQKLEYLEEQNQYLMEVIKKMNTQK